MGKSTGMNDMHLIKSIEQLITTKCNFITYQLLSIKCN